MNVAALLFMGLLIVFVMLWFALTSGGTKVRLLPVSEARIEGDKLKVVIPLERYPKLSFRPLTWGSSEGEIFYTSGTEQVQVRERPSWRLIFDQEEVVYSISPPPTNDQTLVIEITSIEWMRFPLLNRFAWTNHYVWKQSF